MVKRNLVMESRPSFHFVKPSGKHSSRFIKASNVMEDGAEISFIAVNLLKYLGDRLSRVYADTAGVFPLAYELLSIFGCFGGIASIGCVASFGSYQGLDSFEFLWDENTLVLISASTSNDLSKKLRQKPELSKSEILSIFSSSIDLSGQKSLVSFSYYYSKYKNDCFSHIPSKDEHECDLCIYEKSIPLSLANSQFVFEPPMTELYLPVAKDSEKKLKDLISAYKDSGVFKCLYDGLGGKTEPVPEYFIDVSKLVTGSKDFQKKIDNIVIRNFPLSADVILHANDQGALDLASYIKKSVKDLGKDIHLISIDEIGLIENSKGIVVVAGSIQSGKSLLGISRALRKFKDSPITYIVGFSKFNDYFGYEKLKKDIVFNNGNTKLGNHQFIAIEEIMLPLNEHRKNSWERELELLKEIQTYDNSSRYVKVLESRESFLRQAALINNQGIGETIFLESPTKTKMVLGATFAFWYEKDTQDEFSHQATVYFTISSLLQSLRHSKNDASYCPLRNGYVVRQLDPLLFDRFNEGIIHASILRSAKPKELDYSSDDASSSIIGSLIERMIKEPQESTSEALPEFLLALSTGKLKIKRDHIVGLKSVNFDKRKYPLMWGLLKYLKKELFKVDYEEKKIPF
jgi:hypothetical protein